MASGLQPGTVQPFGTPFRKDSNLRCLYVLVGLLCYAFLIGPASLNAQHTPVPTNFEAVYDQPWQITSYETAAGVSQQRAFDIDFETNGTVWLATSDGLRRYDGYTWERFGTNEGLPSAFIRSLVVTRKGGLWVGTDKGAGVFDGKHHFSPAISSQLPALATVRRIAEDPDGTLWFACDSWPDPSIASPGLVSFGNGQWRAFGTNNGLGSQYILNYFRSSTGRRYAMTLSGMALQSGDSWMPLGKEDIGARNRVLMLAEGKNGELFFQQEGNLWLIAKGQWTELGSETALVGTTVDGTPIAVGRAPTQTSLWFSIWDGSQFIRMSAAFPCRPGTRLYKVAQGPDGALWCVGQNTVIRWDYKAAHWQLFPNLPPPRTIDKSGRVWFVNAPNVVYRSNNQFFSVRALSDLVTVDQKNRAWGPAAYTNQLIRVSLDTGKVEPVESGTVSINNCILDDDGILWIVGKNPQGQIVISHREGDHWRLMPAPELKDRNANEVFSRNDGTFWLVSFVPGTVDYELAHIKDDGIEWQNFLPHRPAIMYPNYAIAAGYQWLAGFKALYRNPLGSNNWQEMKPFSDARLSDIIPADNEIFFIVGGNDGEQPACALLRSDGKLLTEPGAFTGGVRGQNKKTVFLFGRGGVHLRRTPGNLDLDYLPLPMDAFPKRVLEDAKGALWVSTANGALRYLPRNDPPQATVLTAPETRKDRQLQIALGGIERFQPGTNQNAFRYSWRFDNGPWSPFQKHPPGPLPINALAVGSHILQVRVLNYDGNTNLMPVSKNFRIVPVPLQDQPWFNPVVAVLFSLIGFLLWLGIQRTRQIQVANATLRQEVEIRRQTETKLQEARYELEQRVFERTIELSAANKNLSREIAERKQVEEMRAKLEEQLRHAQKMQAIGTLAGGIAHDFNNVLAIIIPYTHLAMEQTSDKPEVQEDLNQILVSAERARILVQQILAFSGQHRQERKIVDLGQVVLEGLKLVRSVLPQNVEIVKSIEPGLPPVFADSRHIHQHLVNLCTNAAHAIQDRRGRLEIKVDAIELEKQDGLNLKSGCHVRLTVTDNGRGMPPAVRERAFEPFFTTKPPGEGSGMGLAVVHGIVCDHAGAVRIESQSGIGTSVEVLLPAYQESLADSVPPFPAAIGKGQRVLVVDDEPALCAVLGHVVVHLGYQAATFTRPAAALDEFRRRPLDFDLLLTDLTMPELSGVELAAKIREVRPELPAVLMTGYGHNHLDSATLAGITKIISKPIEPSLLRDTIFQALRQT